MDKKPTPASLVYTGCQTKANQKVMDYLFLIFKRFVILFAVIKR